MPMKSVRTAINEAIAQEMERDPNVIVLGEDVAGGQGSSNGPGSVGGVFGVTAGLYDRFGGERVIDTPISESAIIGTANGAALTGMRPVAEIMFVDFIGVCMDQVYNQAAKFRYMFGGKAKTPWVLRSMIGAGMRAGAQHSQTLHPLFTMIPGLKVVMPTNAYDAKGLLIEAIRDDDPVIFLESKTLYEQEADVPDEAYTIPFGAAEYVREKIRCNAVCPGTVMTPSLKARLEAGGNFEEAYEAILDRQPTREMAVPEDIAPIVVYLASDESKLATGQFFVVDGGWTI